jgi:lipopolysaccharide/colanic/teichoic acid biosynthesis glycosyltransferase
MKRALDFTFALIGLVLVSPLLAVVAIAIKVSDRGPVFFSQTRIGQFGRPFRMHKFRTMVPQAEQQGIPLTVGADRRITRIGHWLRRTKLDELPQLWNVVKGQMSLVGPRPEVPRYVAFYTQEQRRVLDVRPGITDPASLQYFDEASLLNRVQSPEAAYIRVVMPHKLALNLNYLRRRTIASDVMVVFATAWRLVASATDRSITPPGANRNATHIKDRNAA